MLQPQVAHSRRRNRLRPIAFACCSALFGCGASNPPGALARLKVLGVQDGQTLIVQWEAEPDGRPIWLPLPIPRVGDESRARLQGIGTDSSGADPFEEHRRLFLERLLKSKTVRAYVHLFWPDFAPQMARYDLMLPTEVLLEDGTSVNVLLIERGLSPFFSRDDLLYPSRSTEANFAQYADAEAKARKSRVGIWRDDAASSVYDAASIRWRQQRAARRLDPSFVLAVGLFYAILTSGIALLQPASTVRLLTATAVLVPLLVWAPLFVTANQSWALVLLGPSGLVLLSCGIRLGS